MWVGVKFSNAKEEELLINDASQIADGTLSGTSGVGKRTMGALGEQKNLGRTSDEIPTEKTPQWALTDSNRRPSACKADALNQLS